MKKTTVLSAVGLTKIYGGIVAVDQVSLDFEKGEVHALMGENGAGKSTLVKMFAGAVHPESGTFVIDGKEYSSITPKEAKEQGIQLIYQELNLILPLSVAENIYLEDLQRQGLLVQYREIYEKTEALLKKLGIEIRPDAIVETLTVAQKQLVEIAKAIAQDSRVIIMDEPTAALSVGEIEILFRLIRNLKENGVTIIYISHRMNEVFEITDRVSVMRDGCLIVTKETADLTRDELIRHMVGRTLSETFPESSGKIGEIVLQAEHITNSKVHDVSFSVRKGEILGIAGLMGSSRTELVRAVFGADRKSGGRVLIHGREVRIASPKDAVAAGIGLVPEDRKLQGVLVDLSVRDNVVLPILKKISKLTVVNKKEEAQITEKYRDMIRIKIASQEQSVRDLSGGNQQKVALGKWLANGSRILILDEPTRGIDIGAKQEIYQLIHRLAEEGMATILITSDMEEMLGLADRMIILHEGCFAGELTSREDFTQEKVLDIASGRK